MATLLKADGTRQEIEPKNTTDFQLEELQQWVDGDIEIVYLGNKENQILVINDNGKGMYETNKEATDIAHANRAIYDFDYIVGDAVLCKDEEVL